MNEFATAFVAAWSIIYESPLFPLFVGAFSVFLMFNTFRMMFTFFGVEHVPLGFFASIWKWLSDKVITCLCSTEKGFKFAYKLGWARAGVDFFDCGAHCDVCPKYAECNSDLRVAFDDVSHSEDPGAGNCS